MDTQINDNVQEFFNMLNDSNSITEFNDILQSCPEINLPDVDVNNLPNNLPTEDMNLILKIIDTNINQEEKINILMLRYSCNEKEAEYRINLIKQCFKVGYYLANK